MIAAQRQQRAQALPALRPDQSEFGQVAAQGVDRRGRLADQLVAHPMQHRHRLLVRAVDRYPRVPGHGSAPSPSRPFDGAQIPRVAWTSQKKS
jgi:hypothetical protein